jgi:hypothetical protein
MVVLDINLFLKSSVCGNNRGLQRRKKFTYSLLSCLKNSDSDWGCYLCFVERDLGNANLKNRNEIRGVEIKLNSDEFLKVCHFYSFLLNLSLFNDPKRTIHALCTLLL